MSSKYKAAIIGCGRIGASFDSPDSKKVLSHAHAYYKHPDTVLVGVMDLDSDSAIKAGNRWSCNSYNDVEKLFNNEQPNIISLCVPDEFHYFYLDALIDFQPKAVLAEKPLTLEVKKTQEIVARYRKAGIALLVNFSRRYDKTVQRIKKKIDCGVYGKILHAHIKYTKGILHNGSHAIDLANYLFGPLREAKPLSAINDYLSSDPTLNAFLSFAGCPCLFLIAGDERYYSIFEVDIVAEKRRIYFERFGLQYHEYIVRDDPIFFGYKDLRKTRSTPTGLDFSLLNLVDNAVKKLEGKEHIISAGEDALQAQIICTELLTRYLETTKNAAIS